MRAGTVLHRDRAYISVHRPSIGDRRGWEWEVWHAHYRGYDFAGVRQYSVGSRVFRGRARINLLAWVQARLHANRLIA